MSAAKTDSKGRSAKTPKKASAKKKATKKKAAPSTARKKSSRRRATNGAATKSPVRKKTAAKKAPAKKTAKKKAPAKKTAKKKEGGSLAPIKARRNRSDSAWAEERLAEIDQTLNAWADIVAERMSADQTFADLVEQLHARQQPRDLKGLVLWEALHAAEAHVALITEVIAKHMDERRADPVAILTELRSRQQQIAAVYAVNAFLAVLNQMKPDKPAWMTMDVVDPRFAVLALAHQTLSYAIEASRISAPADLTEHIIAATQDEAVWVWRRMPEPGTETLAACAAAAAFFRALDSEVLVTTDEVAGHYAAHSMG